MKFRFIMFVLVAFSLGGLIGLLTHQQPKQIHCQVPYSLEYCRAHQEQMINAPTFQ